MVSSPPLGHTLVLRRCKSFYSLLTPNFNRCISREESSHPLSPPSQLNPASQATVPGGSWLPLIAKPLRGSPLDASLAPVPSTLPACLPPSPESPALSRVSHSLSLSPGPVLSQPLPKFESCPGFCNCVLSGETFSN